MITAVELHRAAEKEGLRFDQVEKDYVILWILSSLAGVLGAESRWVFKTRSHRARSLQSRASLF